jgi:hypothetical protein
MLHELTCALVFCSLFLVMNCPIQAAPAEKNPSIEQKKSAAEQNRRRSKVDRSNDYDLFFFDSSHWKRKLFQFSILLRLFCLSCQQLSTMGAISIVKTFQTCLMMP